MIYPAGSAATCPYCEKILYRTNLELADGDVVKAEHLERVDAVSEPAFGVVIACPDDGPIPLWELRWDPPA